MWREAVVAWFRLQIKPRPSDRKQKHDNRLWGFSAFGPGIEPGISWRLTCTFGDMTLFTNICQIRFFNLCVYNRLCIVFFPWRWGGSSTQAWMPTYVSILRIPQMMWVRRATVEGYWQGITDELGQKHVPVPLCPPQITYGLIRARTRASAVRGRRLRTGAKERPYVPCYEKHTLRTDLLCGRCLCVSCSGTETSCDNVCILRVETFRYRYRYITADAK
jgi:hypothetical protein